MRSSKKTVLDPNDIILRHTPPHSLEAEQAVLGGIFFRSSVFEDMAERLTAEDFYSPANQHIFSAALSLAARGNPIDLVTVAEEMRRQGTLEEAGGPVYLAELAASPVSSSNAAHHAKIVLDSSRRRILAKAAAAVLAGAYDKRARLEEVEALFSQPLENSRDTGGVVSLAESLAMTRGYIESCMSGTGRGLGISTPWDKLTLTLSGWAPGAVHWLGARPGLGKTAMALQAMRHAAAQDEPGLIFSMEMPHDQLTCRNVASVAKVNGQRLRGVGYWEDDEVARAYRAMDDLAPLPIYIDDRPGLTLSRLRAVARRYVKRKGVKFIVIDYFQRMVGEDQRQSVREQYTGISRGIKDVALELKTPILVLAQLNRAADLAGPGHEPKMHHLKETGASEEDADAVMLLWAAMSANDSDLSREVLMRVAKNRNGPEGVLMSFRFNKQHLYFSHIDKARE